MKDATIVNFYAVLGVARGASGAQIHLAYRELAKRLHPDGKRSTGTEAQFIEVKEAYDALRDAARRAALDGFLAAASDADPASYGATNPPNPPNPAGPADYAGASTSGANDIDVVIWRRPAGVLQTQAIDVERLETCPACRGSGARRPSCDGCHGAGLVRARRRLRVRMPSNVRDGCTLRLRRAGHVALDGVTRGDIRVTVRVATTGPARRSAPDETSRADGREASWHSGSSGNEDPVAPPQPVSDAEPIECDPHDALEWFALRAEELGEPATHTPTRRRTLRERRRRRVAAVASATSLLVILFIVSGGVVGGAAGALIAAVLAVVCVCCGSERLCSIARHDANSPQASAEREALDRLKRQT